MSWKSPQYPTLQAERSLTTHVYSDQHLYIYPQISVKEQKKEEKIELTLRKERTHSGSCSVGTCGDRCAVDNNDNLSWNVIKYQFICLLFQHHGSLPPRRKKTKEDFYMFCTVVMEYTQYEAQRSEVRLRDSWFHHPGHQHCTKWPQPLIRKGKREGGLVYNNKDVLGGSLRSCHALS